MNRITLDGPYRKPGLLCRLHRWFAFLFGGQ